MTEECDPEFLSAVKQVEGVDVLIQHPYDATEVFEAVIHVLSRIQSVQTIYSDIHKFKESRKYTHLPIFDDHKEKEEKSVQADKVGTVHLPRVAEEEESDADSDVGSELSEESIESYIVSDFLKNLRMERQHNKYKNFQIIIDPKELALLDTRVAKSLRSSSG